MKLPHLFKNEHEAHFVIFLLTTLNSLLIFVVFFLLVPQLSAPLPKILPVSAQTPTVTFNLITPQSKSTVSGTVPLVTSLTNGPKIISTALLVDKIKVQTLTSRETDRLTIFWDSTKHTDGIHKIEIQVGQNNDRSSTLTTELTIANNVTRNVSQR